MSMIVDLVKRIFRNMLHLLWFGKQTLSNSLSVYVKTNTGNTLHVNLDPKWDIKNVKDVIAPKLGLSPEELKIIFAGKELHDSIVVEECDLGQQSIIHAVKIKSAPTSSHEFSSTTQKLDSSSEGSKPLNETLMDLQLTEKERKRVLSDSDRNRRRAHFYVYCGSPCKQMRTGKLRVRCSVCKEGAFTVDRDPCCWGDVLEAGRIRGLCETEGCSGGHAEFYFKCAEHTSLGEADEAIALHLIKSNIHDVPCLACTEVSDPVLVFPCTSGHVTCLECFQVYCQSRLRERQFASHPELGYTLPCPAGCEDSLITEAHHFRLLKDEEYAQYQRFGAEEYVIQSGGVFCPQPGCGMGILADEDCRRIQCLNGCGFVFCRNCLQGFHIGECSEVEATPFGSGSTYSVDPSRAAQARWDDASKVMIKVISKPCPKCRTPTERDGGCMHMVCTRSQCNFHWCWMCQTEWSRECMGNHWFG